MAPTLHRFVSASSDPGAATNPARPALSHRDSCVLTVAAAALAAGNPSRAGEVIEDCLREAGAPAHPRLIEHLADAALARGDAEAALDTLERGLRRYPDDGWLLRSGAELQARHGHWQTATEYWERVPRILRDSASAWAVAGIARAYRLTGDADLALRLCNAAAASGPSNPRLDEESDLARRAVIDWSACLVPAGSAGPVTGREPAGSIESTGFLHDAASALTGRLVRAAGPDARVELHVNQVPVAATFAVPVRDSTQDSESARFSLNCADLMLYLGRGDTVQVVAGDSTLDLPGIGATARVDCALASRSEELFAKLRQGWVFTKDGRFAPGHDEASREQALQLFAEVCQVIRTTSTQPVYPFYGNLLGAIRDHDFIRHDVGGFDILYLCAARDPQGAKSEVLALHETLSAAGYRVKSCATSLIVRRKGAETPFVDLNWGWFTPDGQFQASFGWRLDPVDDIDAFTAPRTCLLAGREILVPGNSEAVLEQIYGPDWRIPDQGFAVRQQLERNPDYLLSDSEVRALNGRRLAAPDSK